MVSVHILFEPSLTVAHPFEAEMQQHQHYLQNGLQLFSVIAIKYFQSLAGRKLLSILFEPRVDDPLSDRPRAKQSIRW